MNVCNCIKSLDITECIKKEELCKYPCLAIAIAETKINDND